MSDNCDHNFGTFDDFGVKNDQKVSNNMILMSNLIVKLYIIYYILYKNHKCGTGRGRTRGDDASGCWKTGFCSYRLEAKS